MLAFHAGCVDSDSEDSDSDLSDVPEVDSDLEREKEKSYNRDIYKEDAVVVRKKNKAETKAAPGDKKQTAPQEGLQLQFVHGLVFIISSYIKSRLSLRSRQEGLQLQFFMGCNSLLHLSFESRSLLTHEIP